MGKKRTHIWENSLKVENKLYSRADLTERFLIIAHFLIISWGNFSDINSMYIILSEIIGIKLFHET